MSKQMGRLGGARIARRRGAMSVHFFLCVLGMLWAGVEEASGRVCRAQGTERTLIELNADVRSRVAGVGKGGTSLYDGTARIRASLAPGLTLNLYGGHRYGNFLPQQATLEKQLGANRLQAGLVRLPFGIYNTQETYASGLIDYPLGRGDYGYNSVDWGAPGVAWSGGSSLVQIETAYFNGRASGVFGNSNPVGGASARVQTYMQGVILGASHWSGYTVAGYDGPPQRQNVHLNGLDWRYTRPHLLIRGEYLFGSFSSDYMHGAYLDMYYHLPKYGKFTLVSRLEALKPGGADPTRKQLTLGLRYAMTPQWTLSANWRHGIGSHNYDASWQPYASRGGDLLFQAYHKTHF